MTAPAGFRERLRAGERLLGTLISLPAPEMAEIASGAGFDWLFLDMEHGALGPGDVLRLVQALGDRCAALVRVPENREMWVRKALDTGAAGIIVPHVNDAEEAALAVQWAKYPPAGGRGVGFSRTNAYGARFQEDVETANRETVVVAQIEHIDGVRAVGSILDVPGIDALFIGPYDLSASLGRPGAIGDPDVRRAIRAVAAAGASRGTPVGIFASGAAAAVRALEEGYTLVCAGIDVGLYGSALAALQEELRPRIP